jgi:hypothetical protein
MLYMSWSWILLQEGASQTYDVWEQGQGLCGSLQGFEVIHAWNRWERALMTQSGHRHGVTEKDFSGPLMGASPQMT